MRTYYMKDEAGKVIYKVSAISLVHACEKLSAFTGLCANEYNVISAADYKVERDLSLEPLGLASWQKALTRKTPHSAFGF